MTEALRPPHEARDRRVVGVERTLERTSHDASSTYTHVKAGIPVDGDWAVPPPIGWYVLNTSTNQVYFRVAVNSWLRTATLV